LLDIVALTMTNTFSLVRILLSLPVLATILSCLVSSLGRTAFGADPQTPPSLILISVDTLRADHLSCYGYRRASTPHIDAIARGGTIFTQVSSQVPLTLPSHASLLTSTYPFASGVQDNAVALGPDAVTLATVLKSHGYRTGAFVGGFVLDRRFGLNRGFDEYDSPFDLHRQAGKDPSEIKRLGEDVANSAEKWLAENSGSSFFLFLHLYDLHTPYELPRGQRPPGGASGYDAELGYVDDVLGQFWDFLQQRQLLSNTLAVFVSDHGESLGDHGETTHGYFIYQSTLHVPLIFHWPAQSNAFPARIDEPAGLLDVAPTILQYLGVQEPAQFQGRSLLGSLREHATPANEEIYSESPYAHDHFGTSSLRSVRVGAYKYIQAPKPELYDLARDPQEIANLYAAKHALALSFRERLAALRARYQSKLAAASGPSPEVVERLRSLGYLSVTGSHPASQDTGPDPKDRIRAYEEYGRALIQASAGRMLEADAVMERLLNDDPDLIDVRMSLGLDEQRLNQHQQAAQEFQQVLQQDPLNTMTHFNLAVSEFALNRTDDAVKELQAVLAMEPYYTRAEELLGTIWLQKKDYGRAREQFNHLLTVDPNNYAAHYNLGVLAVMEKQWPEGEQHLRAAISTDPSSSEAHNSLGSLYLQLGQLEKARQEFERAVSLQPRFAFAHYNLGLVLHREKQDAEALRQFRLAEEADPQFTPAQQAVRKLQSPER
jgi:choline-sulfatase